MFNLFKKKIPVKYFTKDLERISYIAIGDWVDLRCSTETVIDGIFTRPITEKIKPTLIPLGIAMQLPKGYEAIIAPRGSSFKNFNVLQVNSPGVVDESYCGDNDQWFMPVISLTDVTIAAGDRVCQFRVQKKMKKSKFLFVEVESLNNKDRGGHGSTGTK